MRRSIARPLIFCLLAAVVASQLPAQEIKNPELFAKTQKAAQQALAYYGIYDNPAELRRVADLGYRLAQESKFRDFPITFYLVEMPEPNAFALPGGQIFLTRGMLDLGLTDDMLAGLLGHEIGHVVLEHGMRMQRRATLLNVLSQALLVGVLINASQSSGKNTGGVYDPYGTGGSNSGDLIQGTAAAGAVVSELLMRSYSREFEDEADDEGQRLAAAAGFDPDGTRQLMDKMRAHLPQSREYGYWRTHPFFEERVRAAGVREELLKVMEPSSADSFRARTQAVLLDFAQSQNAAADLEPSVEDAALVAWPRGSDADRIRLDRLHAWRDTEIAKKPLSRDLGRLAAAYRSQLDEVRGLTPDSPLVETLEAEIGELEDLTSKLYSQAAETFRGGVFETEFLEVFLSNFPDSEEVPEVALALADAYSRLRRPAEAVEHYLQAWDRGAEGPAGEQARAGLRRLAPNLESLSALESLSERDDDPALQGLAEARLEQLASSYKELANGADYLRRYPSGSHAEIVNRRLNQLAENLYGELVLYQTVGDHVKGIARIQQILTHAPHSPAAARLRERMVLEG